MNGFDKLEEGTRVNCMNLGDVVIEKNLHDNREYMFNHIGTFKFIKYDDIREVY